MITCDIFVHEQLVETFASKMCLHQTPSPPSTIDWGSAPIPKQIQKSTVRPAYLAIGSRLRTYWIFQNIQYEMISRCSVCWSHSTSAWKWEVIHHRWQKVWHLILDLKLAIKADLEAEEPRSWRTVKHMICSATYRAFQGRKNTDISLGGPILDPNGVYVRSTAADIFQRQRGLI